MYNIPVKLMSPPTSRVNVGPLLRIPTRPFVPTVTDAALVPIVELLPIDRLVSYTSDESEYILFVDTLDAYTFDVCAFTIYAFDILAFTIFAFDAFIFDAFIFDAFAFNVVVEKAYTFEIVAFEKDAVYVVMFDPYIFDARV